MASFGFSVRVYGTLDQQPPYEAENGNMSGIQATYPSTKTLVANLPTGNVNIWGIANGVKMSGGVICYGVVEIPNPGLSLHSTKYVTQETVDALATLRNA